MVDQELFHPIGISHTFAMMANHAHASIYVGAQFIAPSIVHDVNMGGEIGLGRDESRPYMTDQCHRLRRGQFIAPCKSIAPHTETARGNIGRQYYCDISQRDKSGRDESRPYGGQVPWVEKLYIFGFVVWAQFIAPYNQMQRTNT